MEGEEGGMREGKVGGVRGGKVGEVIENERRRSKENEWK